MAALIWSLLAIEDVEEITRFIARDSAAAASALVDRLTEAARQLEEFPLSGRRLVLPRRHDHFRELIVGNYRLIYTVANGTSRVEILRILHGSRRFDPGSLP